MRIIRVSRFGGSFEIMALFGKPPNELIAYSL
jgi:hypothetical protein